MSNDVYRLICLILWQTRSIVATLTTGFTPKVVNWFDRGELEGPVARQYGLPIGW